MFKNCCYVVVFFPVYRTMEGAALVEDVELCVPWDAPEAVVDINLGGCGHARVASRQGRSVRPP